MWCDERSQNLGFTLLISTVTEGGWDETPVTGPGSAGSVEKLGGLPRKSQGVSPPLSSFSAFAQEENPKGSGQGRMKGEDNAGLNSQMRGQLALTDISSLVMWKELLDKSHRFGVLLFSSTTSMWLYFLALLWAVH